MVLGRTCVRRVTTASRSRSAIRIISWRWPSAVEVAMGRLAMLVVACALLVGGVGAPTASVALASRDTPLSRVAVIGDSYTTGSDQGGRGPNAWTVRSWQTLARQGFQITPDVAAEGGAGYGVRGNRGSVFRDLTPAVVRPDDALVLFFGSRNDKGVDPAARAGSPFACFLGARAVERRAGQRRGIDALVVARSEEQHQ